MSSNYASPVSGDGGTPGSYPVFFMPVPIIVARGFQIFLSFVIIVMSGLLMHGLVLSANAFALVCGFFTLIIAIYAIVTEKVTSARAAYNYWAVFALDLLMIIFWLASMGANAALRGSFKYSTHAECYDDGSTFNAGTCYTSRKRDLLTKRYAVAGKVALAEMSAIAGLSALNMLLFVATFAYLAHQVRLHLQAQKQGIQSNDAGVVEMKGQPGVSPVGGDYDYTAYAGAAGVPGAAGAQQQYSAQAQVAEASATYPLQHQPMPYETSATYGGPGGVSAGYAGGVQATAVYDPHAQQQAAAYAPSQHIVSPSATPAPEYQQQQQQQNQYSAAGPAHGTPQPYYSAQSQPYYPHQQ